MKRMKKWLFPVLTCLIVTGAALLPPHLSRLRDAQQLGQVHTEALAADGLPVRQPPSLLDRIELYARQYVPEHPILSFRTQIYDDNPIKAERIEQVNVTLVDSGLLPSWYFTDIPMSPEAYTVYHTLLWDPADGAAWQEPSTFWEVSFYYHDKAGTHYLALSVLIDGESGLPISLSMSDTEMARWLPYQTDALQEFAERYFDLLGLDVQPQDSNNSDFDSLILSFSVPDTSIGFDLEHNATILGIRPYTVFGNISFGGYSAFDG